MDDFADEGWVEAYGATPEKILGVVLGYEVREVVDLFGTIRCRLSSRAPGKGVKGWQVEVFAEVDRHHRHHPAPQGWKFGVEVLNGPIRVGVAVVGRPVSRMYAQANPKALEVTRVCTWGDSALRRNAVSKLYGVCVKEARKIGADRLITYTLEEENGASLRASGFSPVAQTRGGSWNRFSRARQDKAPTGPKTRWERKI